MPKHLTMLNNLRVALVKKHASAKLINLLSQIYLQGLEDEHHIRKDIAHRIITRLREDEERELTRRDARTEIKTKKERNNTLRVTQPVR